MKKLIISLILLQSICKAQMTSPNFSYSRLNKPRASNNFKAGKKDSLGHKNDSLITFYGLTALNGTNENIIDNLTATSRLAVEIKMFKKLRVNIGANLLNANPGKGIKKDSVDFNSLMFPETGNFGFLFNPSFYIIKDTSQSLSLEGTYSYRKIKIDSPSVSFKINSVNIGLKYSWMYNGADDENPFEFTLMGYWNLFNIPDEDVTKFDMLINDPLFIKVNRNAEIYSIGLKTTIQYKSFIFFADLRRNLKTQNLDDNNPFKGTKFNIGFATSFKLKSF